MITNLSSKQATWRPKEHLAGPCYLSQKAGDRGAWNHPAKTVAMISFIPEKRLHHCILGQEDKKRTHRRQKSSQCAQAGRLGPGTGGPACAPPGEYTALATVPRCPSWATQAALSLYAAGSDLCIVKGILLNIPASVEPAAQLTRLMGLVLSLRDSSTESSTLWSLADLLTVTQVMMVTVLHCGQNRHSRTYRVEVGDRKWRKSEDKYKGNNLEV